MPGPLPSRAPRRRNAPTIPSSSLPASGRSTPPPVRPPKSLGKAGKAWWSWAWKTSQAAAWDDGALKFIERRARLEDDLAVLEHAGTIGPIPTDPEEQHDWLQGVEALVKTLTRLAAGELAVMKEMRELDNRLGLNPKALGELRWTIVDDAPPAEAANPSGKPERRLKAVDSRAAG